MNYYEYSYFKKTRGIRDKYVAIANSLLSQSKPKKLKLKKKKTAKRKYKNRIPKSYRTYLVSEHWKTRKNLWYRKFGRACAVCGSFKFANLHHMHYENLGSEKDEDLISLCHEHHDDFHTLYGTGRHDYRKSTQEYLERKLGVTLDMGIYEYEKED